MSAERPVLEQEPREPFDRADCVRCTAGDFSPYLSLFKGGIGPRYLSGDVYVRPGESYPYERAHSLDAAVAQRMNQFNDPGVELTDERLREFNDQEKQARRAFGPTVVTHARLLGLVETLNPEQAKARLELAPYVDLVEQVDQQGSDFSFSGWDVLPTKDSDKRILLVPNRSKKGQVSFETVNLDDLHDRDPKFLPQQVRDYEEKYAMSALANSVTYNLNLHEVPEAELLPEYMREIAQIADPEQRAREIRSMQTFMSWMFRLGDDNKHTVYLFSQGLSRKYADMGDGRSAYIKRYLEHMAECPTQTEETHQRSAELIGAYNALLSVGSNAPSDPSFDLRAQRLTHELAQSYREKIEKVDEALQDIAEDRADVASLKEQTGITDEEIAHLIELATPKDVKDDSNFGPRFDYHLYNVLFYALVLEKQGMVDMRSPAFKGLLKSLLPGKPDRVWQNL